MTRRTTALDKNYAEVDHLDLEESETADNASNASQAAHQATTTQIDLYGLKSDLKKGVKIKPKLEEEEWKSRKQVKRKPRIPGQVSAQKLAKIKRGALSGLMALPFDVLTAILSQIDPYSLYCVSLVSKNLNAFLWSKKSKFLWMASRRSLDFLSVNRVDRAYDDGSVSPKQVYVTTPEPPCGIIDPVYSLKFFSTICQRCGSGSLYGRFQLHIMCCYECYTRLTVKKLPPVSHLTEEEMQVVAEMTLKEIGGTVRYSVEDLETQIAIVERLKDQFGHNEADYDLELGLVRDERRLQLRVWQAHSREFHFWSANYSQNCVKREIAEVGQQRERAGDMLWEKTPYAKSVCNQALSEKFYSHPASALKWVNYHAQTDLNTAWPIFLKHSKPLLDSLQAQRESKHDHKKNRSKWAFLFPKINALVASSKIPNAQCIMNKSQSYYFPIVQSTLQRLSIEGCKSPTVFTLHVDEVEASIQIHVTTVLEDLRALLPGRNPPLSDLQSFQIRFKCHECGASDLQFPDLMQSPHVACWNVKCGHTWNDYTLCEESTNLRKWSPELLSLDLGHYTKAMRLLAALDKTTADLLRHNRKLATFARFMCLDCPESKREQMALQQAFKHVTTRTLVRQYDAITRKRVSADAFIHNRLELVPDSIVNCDYYEVKLVI